MVNGFLIPCQISIELQIFLQLPINSCSRVYASRYILKYINNFNLRQGNNIYLDNYLQNLFHTNLYMINFFDLQKYIKIHFPKYRNNII